MNRIFKILFGKKLNCINSTLQIIFLALLSVDTRGCIFFMNNSFFGIWWRRILHEENRRRNRRIEQLKWMGFSMKLWLKLKIFLTFKWRFSSFIQIEVSRSYKISYIIGATGSDRKQKPVQYFHFFSIKWFENNFDGFRWENLKILWFSSYFYL